MEVLHSEIENKGSFFVTIDGNKEAEMTYTWAGEDKIIIDHTEVNAVLKGQKAGYKMLEKAVDYAREKNAKILPLCPFAKYAMEKNSEYRDIIF